jgi:preprotein translocase subunit SecB
VRQETDKDMAENDGNIISDKIAANGEDTQPQIGMLNQYIKDLSVENPNAPHSYGWEGQPQVDVQVNIQVDAITDEVNEVVMKLLVKSTVDDGVQFSVELDYGTLFGLRNVDAEQAHPFLFGEAPRLMFPFARRVIADAIRDTGFPSFVMEPIDFNSLYIQQREQAAMMAEQEPAGEA